MMLFMQIRKYIHNETAGSLFLILATCLALACANSGLADFYRDLLALPVKIGLTVDGAFYGLDKSFLLWVNDALMTLFFLMIGLEIKRELIKGELSMRDRLLQPLFAAIGGVVVPVFFYMTVNSGNTETMHGWAIACATDIAFALGVLALLGSRVPPSIKILLTAIAIIDDLIAILVIALFYSADPQLLYLLAALAGVALLVLLNYCRVVRVTFYLLSGALIWYGFLKAGVHPTLSGVITAMAIPLKLPVNNHQQSPLIRLEHALHPWIVFGVVPLFAFTNAGLSLAGIRVADYAHPLTLGIILGLVVGKPVGIMLGLFLGHVSGMAKKATRMEWNDYYGMAALCGIGFTMSLFIGDLGFKDPVQMERVKLGVLTASGLMAIIGWALCRFHLTHRFKHSI